MQPMDCIGAHTALNVDWDIFSSALETYHTSNTDPIPVGTSVLVPYKVDLNGEAIDTQWVIMGYNKSIPQYVKYKNGDERIFVSTIRYGFLTDIGNGAKVYTERDGIYTEVGTVDICGAGTYTYGNNNAFTVPDCVTYRGKTYEFAGSNATVMSKYGLVAKYDGKIYAYPQFRSYEKTSQYRSNWSDSEMREWLNGSLPVRTQMWLTDKWYFPTTGTIAGLIGRIPSKKFMRHVTPAVNRVWVHGLWANGKILDLNQCEHVVDRFWLLDVASVNCKGSDASECFPDGGADIDREPKGYGTTRYFDVFGETDAWTTEKSRRMNIMKEDGSKGAGCNWWLMSANSEYGRGVGYVVAAGAVSDADADYNGACFPVCLIA